MIDISDKLNEMAAEEMSRLLEKDKHGWSSGKHRVIRDMQPDKKGDLGEQFVAWLIEQTGRRTICSQRTDPTHKHWDIKVETDDITLEVKTATLGYSTPSFQHEGLEQNRRCDGIVFFDIAPDKLYITCMCKHTFDWKSAHKRRTGIQIKKDLKLKQLESDNHEITSVADFERHYETMLQEILDWRERQRGKPE